MPGLSRYDNRFETRMHELFCDAQSETSASPGDDDVMHVGSSQMRSFRSSPLAATWAEPCGQANPGGRLSLGLRGLSARHPPIPYLSRIAAPRPRRPPRL